jgi:transcription initiation factor TFIID subunit 1
MYLFIMPQVLRFSRLFGPGKPSSLPQIWRSVRKRRRRRKQHHHDHSDSGSDQDNQREKKRGWTFNFAPAPTAEMCESDDEVIDAIVFLVSPHFSIPLFQISLRTDYHVS